MVSLFISLLLSQASAADLEPGQYRYGSKDVMVFVSEEAHNRIFVTHSFQHDGVKNPSVHRDEYQRVDATTFEYRYERSVTPLLYKLCQTRASVHECERLDGFSFDRQGRLVQKLGDKIQVVRRLSILSPRAFAIAFTSDFYRNGVLYWTSKDHYVKVYPKK